jgi:hypothetical protein
MIFRKSISATFGAGVLFAFLLLSPAPSFGGPQLKSTVALSGGVVVLSVSGMQMPVLKRLSLTFAYDPLRTNPANATVSSPVPATAFGAMLDTTAKRLEVNIVATSTFVVAEGAVVSVVHFPASGIDPGSAFRLTAALGTDSSGHTFVPDIIPLAVRRGTRVAALTASAPQTAMPDKAMLLNGRTCATMRASGAWIGRVGVVIALQKAVPSQLIRNFDQR